MPQNNQRSIPRAERLNVREASFVREYLVGLCGKAAAIRAGYSPKSAEVTASKMLAKPRIQAAIAKAMEDRAKRTEKSADDVVRELNRMAFTDIRDFVEWGEDGRPKAKASSALTKDQAAAIQKVKFTKNAQGESLIIELVDKKGTLELLGRHHGIFDDKLTVGGITFVSAVPEPDPLPEGI